MLFVETSARTNKNVDLLFDLITKDVLQKKLPSEPRGQPIAPAHVHLPPKNKDNCC